jgi:hypothetical protein
MAVTVFHRNLMIAGEELPRRAEEVARLQRELAALGNRPIG